MGTVAWDYGGKVAIVIGASSGIGRAIADRLANSAAKVIAVARRAEELAELVSAHGETVLALAADVTVPGKLEQVIADGTARFGRLDVAFNVVGGGRNGGVADLSDEDWDRINNLSLRSIFRAMKLEAQQMIRQGEGGAIVNISSISALVPLPGAIGYACAKAGVNMLTQNAAVELAEQGIRVNALLPGLVRTPKTEPLLNSPRITEAYMARIPMRRAAEAEEMTGPALFLGSSEASYVTGATLIADGGWTQAGYPDLRALR
jgi:NAD(P)-dependent dehydrogenase (short-subunit alcohol dehydrogenase family)